jgi:hypothetical protein
MIKQYNPVAAGSPELAGRIPYKMIFDNGELLFRWIYIGQKKFSEPFFDETILACLSLPQNSGMPYTTVETLLEQAKTADAISPSAFIFHVSRCGSTLLSQMLCMDERFIVLSEVALLDEVLRLPFSHPEEKFPVDELFCALLQLFGKKQTGNENQLFIKTDSWHLFFFEKIRRLFPDVPALLLYRSPKEVIRSQKKKKGMHAVSGLIQPEIFGCTSDQFVSVMPDDYIEIILEYYFKKCLDILAADKNATAISYHNGAIKMLESTLRACNISVNENVFAAMKIRTQKHSKNPSEVFSPEEIIPETLPQSPAEKLFLRLKEVRLER